MAGLLVRQKGQGLWRSVGMALSQQQQRMAFSSAAKQIDLSSDVALQEARTWDEGVSSKFSTTPLSQIFKVILYPICYQLLLIKL